MQLTPLRRSSDTALIDTVGLAPGIRGGKLEASSLTWEATVERIGWVRAVAGERFDHLELNAYPSASAPKITAFPHVFLGSADRLVEKLDRLRAELGITSFMAGEPGPVGRGGGKALRQLSASSGRAGARRSRRRGPRAPDAGAHPVLCGQAPEDGTEDPSRRDL